jgi:hypothetical protein
MGGEMIALEKDIDVIHDHPIGEPDIRARHMRPCAGYAVRVATIMAGARAPVDVRAGPSHAVGSDEQDCCRETPSKQRKRFGPHLLCFVVCFLEKDEIG